VHTLQGKTVKRQNSRTPDCQAVKIPAPIIAQHSNIRLFTDMFFVNGSPCFHTVSEHVKFRTVAANKNRSQRTLCQETRAVIKMYEARGFTITRIEGDREFACMENDLLPIPIDIADADDHVPEVERSTRTVKERTRCLLQGLPFKRMPKKLMKSAVEYANKTLNQFPARNGASEDLSPLTIMTGTPAPDYNDIKIEFGSYAQVFEENGNTTNTMRTRSTGAIAMTPTGDSQGGFFFLSLVTGIKLSRQQWDPLPMPDGVMETVERMAEDEDQPLIAHGAPFFEWRPGVAIEDVAPPPILRNEHEDDIVDQMREVSPVNPPHEAGAEERVFGQEPDPADLHDDDEDDEDYSDTGETGADFEDDKTEERNMLFGTDAYAPDHAHAPCAEHPSDLEDTRSDC
jgi:hypothetical protein